MDAHNMDSNVNEELPTTTIRYWYKNGNLICVESVNGVSTGNSTESVNGVATTTADVNSMDLIATDANDCACCADLLPGKYTWYHQAN